MEQQKRLSILNHLWDETDRWLDIEEEMNR